MAINTVKVMINGSEYPLTYNNTSGKWEATLTAPNKSSYSQTDHKYALSVTATDDHGNTKTVTTDDSTVGESLKLRVKEKVAPVISITSPASSAYVTTNKPTIQFKITDDDSGVDTSTIKVTIDGMAYTTGITKNAVTGGYECSYQPTTALGDGVHTIKVDASDYDGNAATQKSITFTVDTTPPALDIVSPTNGLMTNKTAGVVSGTTNDATSSPVTITIELNGVDQGAVTVGSNGAFSKNVTYALGENTVVITATDSAGKSTTITRTVDVSTTLPTFTEVELVPNPVDAGATYIIKVKVE